MFDPFDPPTDYKSFYKEILRTVEEAEIDVDEPYDLALFTVSRDDEGEVYYIDDLLESLDPETEMEEVVNTYLPEIIKKDNSKFFAFVFPGFEIKEQEGGGPELVCVLTGGLFEMNLITSEIERDEDETYAELSPWEQQNPEDYLNLTIPFRKSITYQSE